MRKLKIGFLNMTLAKKLWVSVIIISLLTVSAYGFLTIRQMKDIVMDHEGESMVHQIESYAESINYYFQNIEKSAQVLLYSPEIQDSFSGNVNELTGQERIRAYNHVYAYLNRFWNNLYGIEAVYLIDRYDNVFHISIEETNMAASLTNEQFIQQGWYERLGQSDGASYWSFFNRENGKKSALLFNAMYHKRDLTLIGYMVVSVSPSVFESFLSVSNLGEGFNSIVDASGLVYTAGAAESGQPLIDLTNREGSKGFETVYFGKEPYVVAYVNHKLTDWSFVHATPHRVVMKDLYHANILWMFFLIIAMLLMLLASTYMLRKFTMPLRRMVKLLREVERGNVTGRFEVKYNDDIGRLGHAFNHMLDKWQEGIPLVREKFIHSLLKQDLTEDELRDYEDKLGIRFERLSYQVVLLYLHAPLANPSAKSRIETVLREQETQCAMLAHTLSDRQFCLIFNCEPQRVERVTEGLIEQLRDRYSMQVFGFAGSGYDHVNLVKNSFEEAKALLKYLVSEHMDERPALFFYKDGWEHQYPESFENRLVYYMNEGNADMCAEVMEELIALMRTRPIVPQIMNAFFITLYTHLNKQTLKTGGYDQSLLADWYSQISELPGQEPFESNARDFIAFMRSQLVRTAPGTKQSLNVVRALELIHQQYCKTDISVDYIANQIGLNTNYFSQLFKKEVGVGFSEYVSAMRLEQSQKLLIETLMKVKDIAEQVGFTDAHYFGVWFKENTGLSPTQFRKANYQKSVAVIEY